jgi:hypothetical protein
MAIGLGRPKAHLRGAGCLLLAAGMSSSLAAPASTSSVRAAATPTLNWSGYALSGSSFRGVTGTFNVPTPLSSASCLEETSVWVGIDGLDNRDLLQAGIAESGFTVPTNPTPTSWPAPTVAPILCSGKAQIYAWWEDLPSRPMRVNFPVQAGDSVTVSIFEMSPGWWALALQDLTAKQSFLMAQPYDGPQTSVEWVVEAPQVLGLASNPVPFSTVDFHDLHADGHARSVEGFTFGSGRNVASPSRAVAGMRQLMLTGFDVQWAGKTSDPSGPPSSGMDKTPSLSA